MFILKLPGLTDMFITVTGFQFDVYYTADQELAVKFISEDEANGYLRCIKDSQYAIGDLESIIVFEVT